MWLLDFLVSITIPFIPLIGVLWGTQKWLSRTKVPKDHPTFQAEAQKLVEAQTAAQRHAMFELDAESEASRANQITYDLEVQRIRQRMQGL